MVKREFGLIEDDQAGEVLSVGGRETADVDAGTRRGGDRKS
jgi:hypothetical protein